MMNVTVLKQNISKSYDGEIVLDLGCTTYMPEVFGGSKNADVNSDIVLNISNGKYDRVFGGNNTSGNIYGSITVNIKEDGCVPVEIGELYLGGYLAGYSVYGYNEDRSLKQSGTRLYADPQINVKSFTSIGNIFTFKSITIIHNYHPLIVVYYTTFLIILH